MSAPSRTARVQLEDAGYLEVKDPCPVLLDGTWHLYGTGITAPHRFELLHASCPSLEGPWRVHAPVALPTSLHGSCLAAPGLTVEDDDLHMYLQTDYNLPGGSIEHLLSRDGGFTFTHRDTALCAQASCDEAGVYDPHPAEVDGRRYLAYSAFTAVGEPDIHLARSASGSWDGPWERLGPIVTHDDVPFHNLRDSPDYEWGLEGAQLLGLPDGSVLLHAVCFLAEGLPGSRQRIFKALAPSPTGPYELVGPLLDTFECSGEHGHAAAVLDGDDLAVLLQERSGATEPWRYGFLRIPVAELFADAAQVAPI